MSQIRVIRTLPIIFCLIHLLTIPLAAQDTASEDRNPVNAATRAEKGHDLISNSQFKSMPSGTVPRDWHIWQPDWQPACCKITYTPDGVHITAGKTPYSVSGLYQDVNGVEGGQAYHIRASGQIRALADPFQSLLVRIIWQRQGKAIHPAGMLVRGPHCRGDDIEFDDILIAPHEADSARVSLAVKWLNTGTVTWQQVSMQSVPTPTPRAVKIGTVFLRPRNSTPEKNLDLWCEQIDQAGKLGLDVVCLGEVITKVGTNRSGGECAKPIPGPVTERLGQAAQANRLWVVAGLTERDGNDLYNTAVLLDRQGILAGTYRKVHLPREEWKKGIRPGHSYPVFKTDFGVIAMQICYDWFFPEPEAIFAQQGAEIIFAPTWGNTLPDADGCVDGETVFRVRARDNGVYMVPSVYSGNSLVIDPRGRILASSQGQSGVFWAEVDLDQRDPLPWVGYWRSIGPRHRRHDTFAPLTKPLIPPAK
jgi:predicted amidohydrolase